MLTGQRAPVRLIAAFAALSVVAAACTGDTTATTSTAGTVADHGSTTPRQSLVGDALGMQSVQDFRIYLDLSVQKDDDGVSFYSDILAKASEGIGARVQLSDGIVLEEVTNLEGEVVDPSGHTLSSLRVDYALLGLDPGAAAAIRSQVLERLGDAQGSDAVGELSEEEIADARLLIEIVTADFESKRLHAVPGDRANLNATFVDSIEPGDSASSIHVSGQSVPGDPTQESGMSPLELFAYRWDQGLISMLGEQGDVAVVLADAVSVIEGSKLISKEIKEERLSDAQVRATTVTIEWLLGESLRIVPGLVAHDLDENHKLIISISGPGENSFRAKLEGWKPSLAMEMQPPTPRYMDVAERRIEIGVAEVVDCRPGVLGCPKSGKRLLVGTIGSVKLTQLLAARVHLELAKACLSTIGHLNRRNEAGGIPITEVNDSDLRGVPAEDQTTDEPPEPLGVGACGFSTASPSPTGGTFGDVHITTVDGEVYENQAAGEFLVYEDTATTVQMRTEPHADYDSVSVMTAAAVKVGDHTVSMHLNDETWIDGELRNLERGDIIAVGDAELLKQHFGWTIVFPDMTKLKVQTFDGSMTLFVTPVASASIGLLGNGDGSPDNDYVTRGGAPVDPTVPPEVFYSTFIDSWRITQEESLFHYEPGESTASFTIADFPAEWNALEQILQEEQDEAERVCREMGVTREDLLEACILDVAVTGDQSFAYQSFLAQANTPESESAVSESEELEFSGDGDSTFTIGDRVFSFGADMPGVGGTNPTWECFATEESFFATSRFQQTEDRIVQVLIDYRKATASDTGQDSLSVIINSGTANLAWMVTSNNPSHGTIESLDLGGGTLTATGTAYLNDPLDVSLSHAVDLPADAQFKPFVLNATCEE